VFTFLRRTPLRIKLVAAVLALVAAALVVIALASSWALRTNLLGQVDNQLLITARTTDVSTIPKVPSNAYVPPTPYLIGIADVHGIGYLIADSSLTDKDLPPLPRTLPDVMAKLNKPYTVRAANGSRDWRMLLSDQKNGQLLIVGQSLTSEQQAVSRFTLTELIAGGAALVVLSALGAAVVRASLRPLVEIERTAAAIAAGDLTRRVPELEPGPEPKTEVGRLGQALNVMLTQIESLFQARAESEAVAVKAAATATAAADAAQRSEARARRSEERMRQFAADASHELRTPLTTIRGFAELYRQGAAASPEQASRLMRRIEDEAARMGMLVEDMLLLARLDQERPLAHAPVDLRVIGADAAVNAGAVAPTRHVDLEIEPGAGSLVVIGDELRLRQVVTNLMTNALTYTPAESPVTVRLGPSDRPGFVELSVIDFGPGLDQAQIDHIFERFYRADTARTRRSENDLSSGTGLGLAIVAAIVAAHGGTVDVTSPSVPSVSSSATDGGVEGYGPGATFRVTLPMAPLDDSADPVKDDI
jgi:two-component system OmpR family sensor kinase